MTRRVRLAAAPAAVAALLALPPAAPAALPLAKQQYAQHDHSGVGTDWHVELTVSRDPRRLTNVVVYVQECDATAYAENVPVAADGSFEVNASLPKGGTWRVKGAFPTQEEAHGEYEVTNARCATGVRAFDAHRLASDGHTTFGTPAGQYPDLLRADLRSIAFAARLWADTLRVAATTPFRTFHAALRRYRVLDLAKMRRRRPLVFHVRSARYDNDRYAFRADRVESLVYYWGRTGPPRLIGFMYRARGEKPPSHGRVFGWHTHGKDSAAMTHVWLTKDLRSAAANCLPVTELDRDVSGVGKIPLEAANDFAEGQPCGAAGDGHAGHDH